MENEGQGPAEPAGREPLWPIFSVHGGLWLSWDNVGWYVAVLASLWGALMGTGDYVFANVTLIALVLITSAKWADHVGIFHRWTARSVVRFSLGIGLLLAALGVGALLDSGQVDRGREGESLGFPD